MCINLQGEETGNHLHGVEEMKTDFRQLRKILEEEYEGLYEYTKKNKYDSLFAGQYTLINRPVNMNEFFSITAPVTVKTAFGHTSVWMHGGYRREGAGIGLQGDVINKIKDKSLKSKRRPGPNAMSVRDKSLKTKEVSCERGWRGKCLEYLKYLEYLELAIGSWQREGLRDQGSEKCLEYLEYLKWAVGSGQKLGGAGRRAQGAGLFGL